jgi:hypothetical protein
MVTREDFEQHSSWHLSRGTGAVSIRWRWEEACCHIEFIAYESQTDRNYRTWSATVPAEDAYDAVFGAAAAFAASGMAAQAARTDGRLAAMYARLTALPADADPWKLNFGNGITASIVFFSDVLDESAMTVAVATEAYGRMSKPILVGCTRGRDGDWHSCEAGAELAELATENGHWAWSALTKSVRKPGRAA